MHDVVDETQDEATYECLKCGELLTSETHPGECPSCGGGVQNRAMSLE